MLNGGRGEDLADFAAKNGNKRGEQKNNKGIKELSNDILTFWVNSNRISMKMEGILTGVAPAKLTCSILGSDKRLVFIVWKFCVPLAGIYTITTLSALYPTLKLFMNFVCSMNTRLTIVRVIDRTNCTRINKFFNFGQTCNKSRIHQF